MRAAKLLAGLVLVAGGPGEQEDSGPEAERVTIEYIAHACFRIHAPDGTRILIDPYADRVWIGYDFPEELEADLVLITHPHYDHDGGDAIGRQVPWDSSTTVLREPETFEFGDLRIHGIEGKHADPYGKEFGQKNTIWLLELGGLRIAHLGDNGPLTAANVKELGRVDILMMPIDGEFHILSEKEVERALDLVDPRIVVPMHYKHPDLEPVEGKPDDLGPIEPWLKGRKNVVQLEENRATFSRSTMLPARQILVFPHSPAVTAPR